jgi:hypothetical protein
MTWTIGWKSVARSGPVEVGSGGMIRNSNGTQRLNMSLCHEIFFDKWHGKQCRPINQLLI